MVACVAPLNLIKGAGVSLVTLLIYKPLSPIIKAGQDTAEIRRIEGRLQ